MEKIEKEIDELSTKIKLVEDQITAVELQRRVPWESLSAGDQELYGSKLEMRLELRGKEKQLRGKKNQLRDEKKLLMEKKLQQIRQQSAKRQRMDEVAIPPTIFKPFNPAEFKIQLKTFVRSGENHLTLVDRNEIVEQINNIAVQRSPTKYEPIVISTSRGMGKTFLLKMIALQKVPAGLECKVIKDARDCGRIVAYDFTDDIQLVYTEKSILKFLPRLMVWYLCSMFKGCVVDGIHFELIPQFRHIDSFRGSQAHFNSWKTRCLMLSTDLMIKEYMRITDVAFGVQCSTPPVFLLDEIQVLLRQTSLLSDFVSRKHTLLFLLLSNLASADHRPVCICTGTNNGNLLQISAETNFVPQILHLTPLKTGYLQNWQEMTAYQNSQRESGSHEVQFDPQSDVIEELVFASYKIPRLLFKAHQVWFSNCNRYPEKKGVNHMSDFEREVASYYSEMKDIWNEFKTEDIAHIMFATGCRWEVPDPYQTVPGTNILWSCLIHKSLIFPCENGCYLFPYSLVWSDMDYLPGELSRVERIRGEVEAICRRLVPKLNIKHLFLVYSDFCVADMHPLSMLFEQLLTASLAVKYYLCRITDKVVDISFDRIYHSSEAEQSIDTEPLAHAVTWNNEIRDAHHDMILYSKEGPIAVQVKATRTVTEDQLKANKHSTVPVLIWMSLYALTGTHVERVFSNQLALLDGSGVCNPASLDILRSRRYI